MLVTLMRKCSHVVTPHNNGGLLVAAGLNVCSMP
jgi:hypothetical protein